MRDFEPGSPNAKNGIAARSSCDHFGEANFSFGLKFLEPGDDRFGRARASAANSKP